jgi:hypothetical protein
MVWDRERLRAALASPRSEAARDAALALGAAGTLEDIALLEQARAAAQLYHAELVARRSGDEREFGCWTAYAEHMHEAWSESVGPFEEGLALLQARQHPDGGVAALVSEGCTVSLLATHIRWRDDLGLFVRLLVVLSQDRGRACAVAFREVAALATCSDPIWRQRAALAIGGWGMRELFADFTDRVDAAYELARLYGWKPEERHRADLLMISLAFGRARFGGYEQRFLEPAISAIASAADPRIAMLLEACLVDAPASSGRDQLRAALQRCRDR